MAKYKYLRLRYIIPSLLVMVLLVFLGLFFLGGLRKTIIAFNNMDFDDEGFIDFSSIAQEEIKSVRLVGHNSKYAMVINEDSTVVTIYKKEAGWSADKPTEKGTATKMYSSAQADGDDEAKSNIILEYVSSNGTTTSVSSYAKSVHYSNITTGTYNKYYKIRYNNDNSVDILYSIGDFAPVVIPDQFNRDTFNEMFVGNTVFYMQSDSEINSYAAIYDANDPSVKTDIKGVEVRYKGNGYCFDNEAALYLLKNGLASISYRLNANNSVVEGYTFTSPDVSAEDEEKILSATKGFWWLTDLLDENGTLKAKIGVNYNTGVDGSGKLISPVTTNPFINSSMLIQILSNNAYEPRDVDENGTIIVQPWYSINEDAYQRVLKFKTEAPLIKKAIYKFLYVGSFEQVLLSGDPEDGTAVYDYIYDDNFYYTSGSAVGEFKDKPVYIDWNQDGKITSDEQYQYGGYQLRDKDGGFVYITDENGNVKPKQMGLLTEDAVAQNEEFGVESTVATVAFDVCLRFALTNDGMDVTVLHESIREGMGADNKDPDVPDYLKHDYMLSKVQLCKYMTVNNSDTSSGEIVLPDGSGCVIEFNSDKSQQYTFIYPEKRIYGSNISSSATTRGNVSENMMLPMYGFIESSDRRAVVAIVKEGAAQTSISADYLRDKSKGGLNKYNYAYFTTYYRETEKVTVSSKQDYTKISRDMYQGDIVYSYRILSGVNTYVDIAKEYQKYLLETYPELTLMKDTTTTGTPTITFLGAYTKKTFKMGIVYEGEYSMTSFDQARDIVEELNANGVENMNIMYRSWTEDEKMQELTDNVTVSKEVGGKKKMMELSNYLKEKGFGFYPEYNFTVGYGYDFAFGSLKYNSKTIAGSYSTSLSYVLSTGQADNTARKGSFISPVFYESLAKKFVKNYKKLDISGIYLIDLGNRNIADYSKDHTVYAGGSTNYQRSALATFKGVDNDYYLSFNDPSGSQIMLKNPYDYAFGYADVITCAPIQTSLYGSVNYSIPLYQLVLSGLVDYSYNPVNYGSDYSIEWNILKAIETGSNIAFVLTAEDTNALLETRYTDYYNAYYPNWKENIVYMNDVLNSTGIYEGYLSSHKYISDNVVQVEYSKVNDKGYEEVIKRIIINYENFNYVDENTGLTIRPNWYAIVEGGN